MPGVSKTPVMTLTAGVAGICLDGNPVTCEHLRWHMSGIIKIPVMTLRTGVAGTCLDDDPVTCEHLCWGMPGISKIPVTTLTTGVAWTCLDGNHVTCKHLPVGCKTLGCIIGSTLSGERFCHSCLFVGNFSSLGCSLSVTICFPFTAYCVDYDFGFIFL